jgi:hypothetical protein
MAYTRKTFNQSCLIEVRRGEMVEELRARKRIGIVRDLRLVPNGVNDPKLICLLTIEFPGGGKTVSASSHWKPVSDEYYLECYPSFLLDVAHNEPAQKADVTVETKIEGPITVLEIDGDL